MALNQVSCNMPIEEDLFEIEVNSAASVRLSISCNPPPKPFEFKFRLSSSRQEEFIPTPADQLFCNGKILPCPPQQINASADNPYKYLLPDMAPPSRSHHVTPFQSCRQPSDSKFDEYFIDYEISNFIVVGDWPQESWSMNVKQRFFGQKLKASREYLKSLFRKKPLFSSVMSKARKSKVTTKGNISCSGIKNRENEICRDRMSESRIRSLFGSINWLSKTKQTLLSPVFGSASQSLSPSPAYFQFSESYDDTSMFVRKRSPFISEPETSVVEAILHCKQSQMLEAA